MASSDITATYRPDGTLEAVTIDYFLLDPQSREDVLEWVKAHNVDPGLLRTPAEILFDPTTDEWSFELFVRGPLGSGISVDTSTGGPLMHRIRRRARRPLALVPAGRG